VDFLTSAKCLCVLTSISVSRLHWTVNTHAGNHGRDGLQPFRCNEKSSPPQESISSIGTKWHFAQLTAILWDLGCLEVRECLHWRLTLLLRTLTRHHRTSMFFLCLGSSDGVHGSLQFFAFGLLSLTFLWRLWGPGAPLGVTSTLNCDFEHLVVPFWASWVPFWWSGVHRDTQWTPWSPELHFYQL